MILDDSNFGITPPFHSTHRWFLRSGFYLSLIGSFLYFFKSNSAIDIQMNDTYLVLSLFHVAILLGAIFLFCGIIYALFYFVFKIPLKISWSKTHYYLTSFPLILMLFFILVFQKQFFSFSYNYESSSFFQQIMTIIFLVFLIGQGLFLLNLITSVWRKIKGKNQ